MKASRGSGLTIMRIITAHISAIRTATSCASAVTTAREARPDSSSEMPNADGNLTTTLGARHSYTVNSTGRRAKNSNHLLTTTLFDMVR
jgi:hypothetical protein